MNDLLKEFSAAQAESKSLTNEVMELMEKATALHAEILELNSELKDKEKDLQDLKDDILAEFKSKNINKIEAYNFEFKNTPKLSVKVPVTPEAKEKFFQWLKDKDLYYSKVSVHSATLNKTYNEAYAEWVLTPKEEGQKFEVPGLDEPAHYNILEIKPVKEKKVKLSRAKI